MILPRRVVRPPNAVPCLAAVLALAITLLSRSSHHGPGLRPESRYVADTPAAYTETRVFCLASDAPGSGRLSLLSADQAIQQVPRELAVHHNDPLSVIVNGVYLPPAARRRDIAVIADIASLTEGPDRSLVVWYQRDVPGDQMLNFRDLLVYFDPAWNAAVPPHFRLRVLAVSDPDRLTTARFLEQTADLTAALGGLMPHPAIPGVVVAIEAARLLLANRGNEVLLDYTVQLYSQQQRDNAGQAPLNVLRRGPWMVVGRPAGQSPAFWSKQLWLNQRTGRLRDDTNTPIDSPYVAMTISTAEAVVPSIVVERSAALLELLTRSGGQRDLDDIEAQGRSLHSAIQAFLAHQRLVRYRTLDDVRSVMTLLRNRELQGLGNRDTQLLMSLVSRVADRSFTSVDDALAWWEDDGQFGSVDPDRFRWIPNDTRQTGAGS